MVMLIANPKCCSNLFENEAGQFDGMCKRQTISVLITVPGTGNLLPAREDLFPLLMTILSQSFFTLMRRNFMTLSFFTTRHLR
jgi:hypothetical protein